MSNFTLPLRVKLAGSERLPHDLAERMGVKPSNNGDFRENGEVLSYCLDEEMCRRVREIYGEPAAPLRKRVRSPSREVVKNELVEESLG